MIAVAIDGPAGAGKSTLSRRVAAAVGFRYVDTGAIYRTVAVKILRSGLDVDAPQKIEAMLASTVVDIEYDDEKQIMLLDGEDVTGLIRAEDVSMMASKSSALPCVRAFLLEMQREMAKKFNVVMDGRDIGTVVLPDANIKIFLTASPESRAQRRYEELVQKGAQVKYEDVYQDMLKRDHNDSSRAIAPLKPAEDAIILDTSGNTFEQSLELLITTVKERL